MQVNLSIKLTIILCLLWCWFSPPVHAQIGTALAGRLPEAQTQDELDLYLEIADNKDAHTTVELVNQFAHRFPDSRLLGLVYQEQMRAFQQLNDYEGVLRAGTTSLRLQPNNLNTLLALSTAIPNGIEGRSDRVQLLNNAEACAHRALDELKEIRIPNHITLERWEFLKGEMQAQAHEALGHVAIKRGHLETALREFETAALNNPLPQGSQFFRLGACYLLVKKFDQAEIALRRAIDLGPEEIRRVAHRELEKLKAERIISKNNP